jgi:hypothetical protein
VSPSQPLRAIAHRTSAWQQSAWDYFDSIGELRFAVQWIANATSRVNLIAAAPSANGGEPRLLTLETASSASERRAIEIVNEIANGNSGQGQMLSSLATHLTIAGIGWIVAEPTRSDSYDVWEVYSTDEIRASPDGKTVEVRISEKEWRPVHSDAVVVKAWRRHPRWSWQPDAPTRGVLPVLREIELLQQHIHASAQSRLAGAGVLAIPSEAIFPPGQGPQSSFEDVLSQNQNVNAPEDSFVDTLVESMTVPIVDRSSAAAVVPLVVRIPGEYVDKIRHLTFATPFDDRVLALQEAAIKRLALGMDIPPEIITGVQGMNHWGAWQVAEEAITLHIEPLSETICHALTVGFLEPALRAEGLDPAAAMVWYDTSELASRPSKAKEAFEAFDRLEISRESMLREIGLSADDLPSADERRERILLGIAQTQPGIATTVLAELGLLVPGASASSETVQPEIVAPVEPPSVALPENGPPASTREAVVAASDLLVLRALERAGARLRSAAGRGHPGGAAAVECPDPVLLHTMIPACRYASLESLLDGAWTFVPEIAGRYGLDASLMRSVLDRYARRLIERGESHKIEGLRNDLLPIWAS